MLVLTRQVGEEILIGAGWLLTLVEVKGNRVRLGFSGIPKSVKILREELDGVPTIDKPHKNKKKRSSQNKSGMLVIGRKVRQSILIGDEKWKVTVARIDGRSVRLGLEFPKDIAIKRAELEKSAA